ncbi:hypothetical protein BCY86_02315 [Pajaroellobacter abortibovis]|uniref:Uncharacterized protein n=1 Tax=Pajaroellobacter abortibovis TaxID=1882918 RepID=A0A1L6MW27_9BACT|nr:hypothetical protein BCY86_02315 [Pajaroellobacter abortibovis]
MWSGITLSSIICQALEQAHLSFGFLSQNPPAILQNFRERTKEPSKHLPVFKNHRTHTLDGTSPESKE